jgi:cytochrome c556
MQRLILTSRKVLFGTAMVFGLATAASVQAAELGAEATIDYRQGVMSAIGGNMAASAAIIMDQADYRDRLATHVRFIVDMTEDIPSLFPEGSDFGETDALPSIWEDPETFAQRSRDNHAAAVALHEAVEAGDEAEIAQRFRAVGQSCRACHDDFRHRD